MDNFFHRLSDAMDSTDFAWTLCLVGEDQSQKMSELTRGLRGDLRSGEGKQISSGFAYWGIGPTLAWSNACNDVFYPVMKESLRKFSNNWRQVSDGLDGDRWNYVSLGVGNGQKDRLILEHLTVGNPDAVYVPVDMSSEMLGLAQQETAHVVPRERTLPIQLDISSAQNVEELKRLLRRLLGDGPVLFGLLGNTLANFEADDALLRRLSELLRPQDRFLLELATTQSVSDRAQDAADEYVSSRFFREFVTSSLLHYTDLTMDMEAVEFHGSVETGERAVRVEIRYYNKTGQVIRMSLPNREQINFDEGQSIRVYLTRKYSVSGLRDLISKCGMVRVAGTEAQVEDRRRGPFGIDLVMLSNDPNAQRRSDNTDIGNQIGTPTRRQRR